MMFNHEPFAFRNDVLHCEKVSLPSLAQEFGTPAYVYSGTQIRNRYRAYAEALRGMNGRICYAVKANSNAAVLSLLAHEGAGFDIVSGGELFRVLHAGGQASSVVFSGVGKTEEEIRYALEVGIHSFNCESESELQLISQVAIGMGTVAAVALRVNPDVEASTHPYISTGLREHKFGVDIAEAPRIYAEAAKLAGLRLHGVSCHIGSQLLDVEPVLEAADRVLQLAGHLRQAGVPLQFVDLGGGLGVPYRAAEKAVPIGRFLGQLKARVQAANLALFLEPGRSIVAEAGVLLSRVLLVKQNGGKTFVILDSGMNDLIRPSLYSAHHEITPVHRVSDGGETVADIVGPVCESGDFFALGREIPSLKAGDLVAIRTAGAYGFVLSSNYNSRPRVPEILIEGSKIHLARSRERYEDLVAGESILEFEEPALAASSGHSNGTARDLSSKSS